MELFSGLFARALFARALFARKRENRYPPLFVIGAPRSGTTLVGLHAVASFGCAYLPNASKEAPERPLAAARAALAQGAWRPSYANRYGMAEGPLAPSDGWDVLNRWFPLYQEAGARAARAARPFRDLVAGLEELFGGPFFLKNNHNAMRVAALAELFPGAGFVAVRRERVECVRSLLEARARHGVAPGAWWSAAPPQYLGRAFESELEQAVATVVGLERHVERRFAQLDPLAHLTLDYDEFCARPELLTDWIAARYARLGVELARRPGAPPAAFAARRAPAGERLALEQAIAPIAARLEAEETAPPARH